MNPCECHKCSEKFTHGILYKKHLDENEDCKKYLNDTMKSKMKETYDKYHNIKTTMKNTVDEYYEKINKNTSNKYHDEYYDEYLKKYSGKITQNETYYDILSMDDSTYITLTL